MPTPDTPTPTTPREKAVYTGRRWHAMWTAPDGFHSEELLAGTLTELEDILAAMGATYWEVAEL